MGSFGGHALPGSFFIIAAIWWAVMASLRYSRSKRRGTRFLSSASFTCQPSCCRKTEGWPIESIIKVCLLVIGGSIEIITGIEDGQFKYIGNAQHATMFFYFVFGAVVEILLYFKAPLPPHSDYMVLAMGFMVEGLLFKFHLHGRDQLDVLVHTLLIYTIYACIICVFVEMKFRRHLLSPLARAYLVLLQGTWFWQVAFILYNPAADAVPWEADNHVHMTMVTLFFAWHALADFIIVIVISAAVQKCCRLSHNDASDDVRLKRLIHSGKNGYAGVSQHENSESECELESLEGVTTN